MKRYGKPSAPLLSLKPHFFNENEELLQRQRDLAGLYTKEPRRLRCKACDGPIETVSFSKLGIDYLVCPCCGHLNGAHEDSDTFCAALYTEAGGAAYARDYSAADREAYRTRTGEIYVPKARFLADSLAAHGEDPKALAYADIGAGSGYFVSALRFLGLDTVRGYEVSETQTALANEMAGEKLVETHALDDTVALAGRIEAKVVSLIGVLEHLQQPRELLAALNANPAVSYVYISVPLFSPSVFIEAAFQDVMQRHLSGAHTHLYSESSLDWTCREFGMTRVAEWWFGADIVDLYRSILIRLAQSEKTAGAAKLWAEMIKPAVDDMQEALDRRHLSSEVHMLLQFDGED